LFVAAAAPSSAQVAVRVLSAGEIKDTWALRGDVQPRKEAYGECQSGHRRDGSGRSNGGIPRLSGQCASVLIKQIMGIRVGAPSTRI
jgi:cytochrome c553